MIHLLDINFKKEKESIVENINTTQNSEATNFDEKTV